MNQVEIYHIVSDVILDLEEVFVVGVSEDNAVNNYCEKLNMQQRKVILSEYKEGLLEIDNLGTCAHITSNLHTSRA